MPKENVLGDVGHGFKVAMRVLNSGRLGLAAGCVGSCKALIEMTIQRVGERRALNKNLGEFGLKQLFANGSVTEIQGRRAATKDTVAGYHGRGGKTKLAELFERLRVGLELISNPTLRLHADDRAVGTRATLAGRLVRVLVRVLFVLGCFAVDAIETDMRVDQSWIEDEAR